MSVGKNITAEKVREVLAKKKQYPSITNTDLAAMCGVSQSSVSRCLNGEYDHLVNKKEAGVLEEVYEIADVLCDQLAEISEEIRMLHKVLAMNNELMRVIALNVTSMNDPSFTKSKNVSAGFRQDVIEATYAKTKIASE